MTQGRRPAGQWEPSELGVHRVTGGGLQGSMPPYIRRPHDEVLRVVLDPAEPASRLVVLRGDSCTGRSRAVYEAIADRLPDWPVCYPVTTAELGAGVPARTVLWLGELRRHVDADDGATVLGHLDELLYGEGHLVIATVWPQDWDAYAAAAAAGRGAADPARVAGQLLARLPELTHYDLDEIEAERGGVIDVPDRFAATELAAGTAGCTGTPPRCGRRRAPGAARGPRPGSSLSWARATQRAPPPGPPPGSAWTIRGRSAGCSRRSARRGRPGGGAPAGPRPRWPGQPRSPLGRARPPGHASGGRGGRRGPGARRPPRRAHPPGRPAVRRVPAEGAGRGRGRRRGPHPGRPGGWRGQPG